MRFSASSSRVKLCVSSSTLEGRRGSAPGGCCVDEVEGSSPSLLRPNQDDVVLDSQDEVAGGSQAGFNEEA